MLGIVVVNYNTSAFSLDCLRSVLTSAEPPPLTLLLVDSGSSEAELELLHRDPLFADPRLRLLEMGHNAGFAACCNRGIAELLAEPLIGHVLLLNNDAVLEPEGLSALLETAVAEPAADMIAGRMQRFDRPAEVDSLGIALYASLLASNRMTTEDRLLGPTGGLALYTRRLLEALQAAHGHRFDERFFCYAEDTDLAMRARLLGFEAAYCDRPVARHRGQASSGGGFSDFVLYHGIRNSIWAAVKCVPGPLLLALAPLALALHCGIILRHSLRGKLRVVWALYRDALRGLGAIWRARRRVQATRTVGSVAFWRHVTPRFYDRDYLRKAWRELWRRA